MFGNLTQEWGEGGAYLYSEVVTIRYISDLLWSLNNQMTGTMTNSYRHEFYDFDHIKVQIINKKYMITEWWRVCSYNCKT